MATDTLGDSTVCRISSARPASEIVEAARDATDVPVVATGSTGAHALEPLLMVTSDGSTGFFSSCTAERAADVAARLDGEAPLEGANAVVDHGDDPGGLPTPDLGALGVGTRSVLDRCGWVRPTDADDYEASGGFAALDADREAVLDAARAVAGRGWGDAAADEPLGETWDAVADAAGEPAVVVNGHGAAGDRLLLESAPHLALEGAVLAAHTVDASEVVVYLSEADDLARERVREAARNRPKADVEVRVATGVDEHRAAEPTMALEAIEGNHRLEARLRPPGPAESGLHGRPTLIHTPRTLAQVVRAVGGADPTRVVSVGGDVASPATVELPEGASLAALRDAVTVDGEFKAARVGGRFGGLTPTLDVDADADSLVDAGLGTEGAVDVLNGSRCVVAYVGEQARYGQEENCGRCVPCREGSKQLTNMLRDVYDGAFEPDDIEELLRVMRTSSICGFGRDLARPVATALDHFEGEFVDHADGRCRAGSCDHETKTVTP